VTKILKDIKHVLRVANVVVLPFSPIANPHRIKSEYKLFLFLTSPRHWLGLHQQRWNSKPIRISISIYHRVKSHCVRGWKNVTVVSQFLGRKREKNVLLMMFMVVFPSSVLKQKSNNLAPTKDNCCTLFLTANSYF